MRTELLETFLNISCLLFIIVNNLLYLISCASVMKNLLNTKTRTTIRRSYEAAFRNLSILFVKKTEEFFRTEHSKADNAFECCYKQLWLYSMRHFPEMIDVALKKECDQPNPPEGNRIDGFGTILPQWRRDLASRQQKLIAFCSRTSIRHLQERCYSKLGRKIVIAMGTELLEGAGVVVRTKIPKVWISICYSNLISMIDTS